MLTHQQINTLETAWKILDKLRNCQDFNESHDLTIGDACAVLSDFLDWSYERDCPRHSAEGNRQSSHQQSLPLVNVATLESFRNL